MFGLRTIVVVGAAIMLLPSDPAAQQALVNSVQSNAQWALTYCDREPESCDRAKAAAVQFGEKLKFAAKLAGDVIRQQAMTQDPAPVQVSEAFEVPQPVEAEPSAAEPALAEAAPAGKDELGHLLDAWEQENAAAQ